MSPARSAPAPRAAILLLLLSCAAAGGSDPTAPLRGPTAPAETPRAAAPLPRLGSVLISGTRRVAVLDERVRTPGETLGPWRLEAVDPAGVWLAGADGRRLRVDLVDVVRSPEDRP